MTPKFKIGEPIVVDAIVGTYYYRVSGILKNDWGMVRYFVSRDISVSQDDLLRIPTDEELLNYYS